MKRYALFSLSNKQGSEEFAEQLIKRGFTILSSGGTATHLHEKGVEVTDASEITGYPPVLGHRVVTLAPQIHGGLLATPQMKGELESLKWPWIDLVYVNFYPLQEELGKAGSTFESCIEKTDIGGPTVIRSANKGGRIVLVSKDQIPEVLHWIDSGEQDRESFVRRWSGIAEGVVANYACSSAEVYEKFRYI
jgi:phosphoribosylaminoimidazolecarboxamide formyltransferase/IMP cyclohydrolase